MPKIPVSEDAYFATPSPTATATATATVITSPTPTATPGNGYRNPDDYIDKTKDFQAKLLANDPVVYNILSQIFTKFNF